jgi:hypothetical protein
MTMPRLSLYRPEKSNDYKFIDKTISEIFTVGGTDLYYHKLLGTRNPTTGTGDQPIYAEQNITNIQDLLFLENRDRVYDKEIYRIRGHYQVQNLDWNLSQFGLFLENDTINMTVHMNDMIATIGRKPVSGDVFELPHLADYFAFNDLSYALPRYFVITDVNNASEGYSPTWFPHLYRLKCKKITDSQQFADILNQPARDANGDPIEGTTVKDAISQLAIDLQINDAVLNQAEADAAKSGFETQQFYTMAVDPSTGKPIINTADETILNASSTGVDTNDNFGVPVRSGYTGYLVGDGIPQNGYTFGFGIQFPANPLNDDFFLRTDFLPNRLFRFNGASWSVVEDAVRMSLTNTDTRQTYKTGFINNSGYIYNESVATTYITLSEGDFEIETNIDYTEEISNALYASFKIDVAEYGILCEVISTPANPLTDYPNIITNNGGKVKITLPVINSIQQVLAYTGQYKVGLYNNREAVRQSLSTALRPKADF